MSNIEQQLAELSQTTLEKLKEIQHQGEKNYKTCVLRFWVKRSLTDLLKGLKDLSNEMKPIVGKQVNEVRDVLTAAFEETAQKVAAAKIQQQLASETIDVTLPGRQVKVGKRHVLTQTSEEIEDIFLGMGFQIVDGFEVEKTTTTLSA